MNEIITSESQLIRSWRYIDKIIVHCSATREGVNVTVPQIDKMHRKRKFSQIGYHYVVDLAGNIRVGRPVTMVGAHTTGYNTGSIGICYVGGLDSRGKPKDTRTYQQNNGLYQLIKYLCKIYDIKEVKGHRDYSPDKNGDGKITKYEWIKSCPCFDVEQFMEETQLKQYLKS